MDIDKIAAETVKQYYNMNKEQKEFINKLISSDIKFNRYDLIKSLILFNKAKELNCEVDDEKLDSFTKKIDKKSKLLNKLIIQYDNVFRSNYQL